MKRLLKISCMFFFCGTLITGRALAAVPDAPTNVTAFSAAAQAAVSWSAPAHDGGAAITGYTVTAAPGNAQCVAVAPNLTCTVMGLTNGTSYTFTVRASNVDGAGPVSAPSNPVTPQAAPDAPTGVSVRPENGGAMMVMWSAPASNGGMPITTYTATASPGGMSCITTGAFLQCQVIGLTSGTTYTFSVTATNAIGTGTASSASSAVKARAAITGPNAPVITNVVTRDEWAEVTWSGSTDDGGRTITHYIVTATPGGATCSEMSAPLACRIEPLTYGVEYSISVQGVNAIGAGASSAAVLVTPSRVPDAPTGITGVSSSHGMMLSWTAPNNGGSPITSYTATASPGNRSCTTPDGMTTQCEITQLANKWMHTFVVAATNVRGTGPASNFTPLYVDAQPEIVYESDTLRAYLGSPVSFQSSNTGGSASLWHVSPALPPGMLFDINTGLFHGTPTSGAPAQLYRVIATGPAASAGPAAADTAHITIIVVDPSAINPSLRRILVDGSRTFHIPASPGASFLVSVLDMKGRAVWSRRVEADAVHATTVTWDGRTRAGMPVPRGLYLLRTSRLTPER